MPLFSDFNEKVQFVLENVEFYTVIKTCNMQKENGEWKT